MKRFVIACVLVLGCSVPLSAQTVGDALFRKVQFGPVAGPRCTLQAGSGTPEGALVGDLCDLYLDTDTGDLYIKTDDAGMDTGWTAAGAGSFGGFADGSQAAPGAFFTSDTDLGIWRIGANNAGVVAANTAVFDWTNARVNFEVNSIFNNVGIGSAGGTFTAPTRTVDFLHTYSGALAAEEFFGARFGVTFDPNADRSDAGTALYAEVLTDTDAGIDYTADLSGIVGAAYPTSSGTVSRAIGVSGFAEKGGTGAATSVFGGIFQAGTASSANATTLAGIYIDTPYKGSGTVTTSRGIFIADQTLSGATAHAIYYDAPSSADFGVRADGKVQLNGVEYTWPSADGSGANCLATNGSAILSWQSCGGAGTSHNFLSATHTDTAANAAARGAVIVGNSTPNWARVTVGSAGQALVSDGTDTAFRAIGPASVSLLTSGTAATYTVPAGIYHLRVRLIGAGGGGGGADGDTSQAGVGGGGYGGGYVEKTYQTTPGATFTYTIGALGTGGTAGNNAGTAGGNTLFDEAGSVLTGSGGAGGTSFAAGTSMVATGASARATATGGDVNIAGAAGHRGTRFSGTQGLGGQGADSLLGTGGLQGGVNNAGAAGTGYGSGGGGGAAFTNTDRAGGDGTPGVIIVEEYK